MSRLTEKNRQAIEVYLGAGSPESRGNGTRSWQEVYGTKNAQTARANWSRMLTNASAKEYLEQRREEIESATTEKVSERISYEVEDALRVLMEVQEDAMKQEFREGEDGDLFDLGMRDRKAAIQAAVEALKVQGKYVTKSESTSTSITPADRTMAARYRMSLTEYMERKADGNLPPMPPLPTDTVGLH